MRHRIQQAALAGKAGGQCAHGVGGVAEDGRQRLGIGRVRVQQAAGAGDRLAQAIDQAAQAGAQSARQAGALDGGAQVADQAAHLFGDAVHGLAQAGRGAHFLSQSDHRIDDRRQGGIQRFAHAAQCRAQIQGQGVVHGVAGIAQGGLQQAGRHGIDGGVRVGAAGIGGVGATRIGAARVGATRVGGNIGAGQAS
ncbi:hypothetical protein D3C71_1457590 [compost metagenome]